MLVHTLSGYDVERLTVYLCIVSCGNGEERTGASRFCPFERARITLIPFECHVGLS